MSYENDVKKIVQVLHVPGACSGGRRPQLFCVWTSSGPECKIVLSFNVCRVFLSQRQRKEGTKHNFFFVLINKEVKKDLRPVSLVESREFSKLTLFTDNVNKVMSSIKFFRVFP